MQTVEVAKANPTWGTPATPIPPITDAPQIIITSPTPTPYTNPVALNITVIQPDSWVSKHNMTLPQAWIDNSDDVVVGQNTLRSITCIIDGQSFILWNGTHFDFAVTYYLPRETQFSALMSLSKGQHTLQVNVSAISEYSVEGIIPFAYRTYNISASQTVAFDVSNDGGSPTLFYDVRSSYEIWQTTYEIWRTSSDAPSSTPAPSNSSMEIPSPIPSPTPNPTITPIPTLLMSASLAESASALDYGNRINFTVSVEGGKPPYSYAWYIDSGLVENNSSQYYSTNNQSIGAHHVYVRVVDAENNMAQTLTVEFNVLPSPTSTLSPSASPTTQQTNEPSPTPIVDHSYGWIPYAVVLVVVLALAALAIYVRRRK